MAWGRYATGVGTVMMVIPGFQGAGAALMAIGAAEEARAAKKKKQQAESASAQKKIAAESGGTGKDFVPSASQFHPITKDGGSRPGSQYGLDLSSTKPQESEGLGDLMKGLSEGGLGDAVTGSNAEIFRTPEPDLTGIAEPRLNDVLPARQGPSKEVVGAVTAGTQPGSVSTGTAGELGGTAAESTEGIDAGGIANYAKLGADMYGMYADATQAPPSAGIRSAHMGGPMMRVTGQSSPDTLNALLAEIKKRRGF